MRGEEEGRRKGEGEREERLKERQVSRSFTSFFDNDDDLFFFFFFLARSLSCRSRALLEHGRPPPARGKNFVSVTLLPLSSEQGRFPPRRELLSFFLQEMVQLAKNRILLFHLSFSSLPPPPKQNRSTPWTRSRSSSSPCASPPAPSRRASPPCSRRTGA